MGVGTGSTICLKTQTFPQVRQEDGEHALEGALLAANEPNKCRQGDQQQHNHHEDFAHHSTSRSSGSEEKREHGFGLQRPTRLDTATQQLPFLRMRLGGRGELHVRPAAAIDFHVEVAPSDISFIRPSLAIQFGEHRRDKCNSVDRRARPVLPGSSV